MNLTKAPRALFVACLSLGVSSCTSRTGSSLQTRSSPPSPSSSLFVQSASVKPAHSLNKGYDAYRVVAYIAYKGQRPAWWGESHGMAITSAPSLRFIDAHGKPFPWSTYGLRLDGFDQNRQQYYITGETDMPSKFNSKDARLAGALQGPRLGNYRFNVPIVQEVI